MCLFRLIYSFFFSYTSRRGIAGSYGSSAFYFLLFWLHVACEILVPWLGIKPSPSAMEVESLSLNHKGSPLLSFFSWGTSILFSIAAAPIYIPTESFQGLLDILFLLKSGHLSEETKEELASGDTTWALIQPYLKPNYLWTYSCITPKERVKHSGNFLNLLKVLAFGSLKRKPPEGVLCFLWPWHCAVSETIKVYWIASFWA